jgi:hypothetical protein
LMALAVPGAAPTKVQASSPAKHILLLPGDSRVIMFSHASRMS